ncbi:TerB family tellurite resistance protein [Pelagibacteraceae bacterium]|nr:TerB family tellurite resistance protein [Pelagibacteraceae bacterium]
MINLLKNILNNQSIKEEKDENKNLELLCGLMIEAAYTDGKIDEGEINKIKTSLIDIFNEDQNDVILSIDKALKNKNNSKSLYYYTSFINKNFTDEKKFQLIEALWEIILSDGEVDDFESSLIRRLAGLLYISDVKSGNARKRALDKFIK